MQAIADPLGTIYGIHEQWVLRNDLNKLVLHKVALDESKSVVLPPSVGLVIPLLDGKRTLGEAAALYGMIVGENDLALCANRCASAIRQVNQQGDIVVSATDPHAQVVAYSPQDFVPDWSRYAFSFRLNIPFSAMVFLTNRCKTDCLYCYADRRQAEELSVNEWRRITAQMKALGFYVVGLTGGDPLARSDSIDIVCEFARAGMLFLLSTKCPVEAGQASQLAACGFNEPVRGVFRKVQISLDSVDSSIADKLTGARGYLDRANASVTNLLDVGIVPRIKAVMTSMNADQVVPLVEAYADKGITSFGFSVYNRSGYRHDDSLYLSEDQKRAIADDCARVKTRFPQLDLFGDAVHYAPASDDSASREQAWSQRAGCSGGFNSVIIAPDGKVILCEQIPQEAPYIVGDLRKQTIMEVWNSEEMAAFLHPGRELFAGTICHDCEEFDPCHYEKGWCYREALFAFGSPYAPPPACPRVEDPPDGTDACGRRLVGAQGQAGRRAGPARFLRRKARIARASHGG